VTVHGSTVVFGDEVGGRVVLGRTRSKIGHQGSVAVRGPYGLTFDMLRKHGLEGAKARAVEFVAFWFGAPFDAVAIDRESPGDSLAWGFWPLAADDTCRALALWKEQAPASFASLLQAYGLDVSTPSAELEAPVLTVADPARDVVVRGERALDAFARDPRRLALLARAGRNDDAKAAQLEVAMRGSVLPLLKSPVVRGAERKAVGDAIQDARALAGLILGLRAFDLTGMADVLSSPPGKEGEAIDATAWVELIADGLRGGAYAGVSHAMRSALSSPELGT
jgi:hypothetical protein